MRGKGVAIDWEELGFALTWRTDEGRLLDRQTGEVIAWTGADDPERSEDEMDGGLAEGPLIPIDTLPSSVEYGWMVEFAAAVADPGLRRRLGESLAGSRPFLRFKDVLAIIRPSAIGGSSSTASACAPRRGSGWRRRASERESFGGQ